MNLLTDQDNTDLHSGMTITFCYTKLATWLQSLAEGMQQALNVHD
jgi:hypothetical protein